MASRRFFDGAQEELGLLPIEASVSTQEIVAAAPFSSTAFYNPTVSATTSIVTAAPFTSTQFFLAAVTAGQVETSLGGFVIPTIGRKEKKPRKRKKKVTDQPAAAAAESIPLEQITPAHIVQAAKDDRLEQIHKELTKVSTELEIQLLKAAEVELQQQLEAMRLQAMQEQERREAIERQERMRLAILSLIDRIEREVQEQYEEVLELLDILDAAGI